MKKYIYPSLLLCLILGSCAPGRSPEEIDEEQTRAVLEHHWKAFKENDMEAVMADYTGESFLITPDTTYRGLAAIRDNFKQAFRAFPADQDPHPLTLLKMVVEQDVGYIIWQASTPSMRLRFATDTFIIRNGKIIRQTYGGITEGELE